LRTARISNDVRLTGFSLHHYA